jgi:tetratricopeptide (TPR) repeat protein
MEREEQAVALYVSGQLRVALGQPEAAIEPCERAIAIVEESGHSGILPEAERVLSEALLELGRVAEAERHALRATQVVAAGDVASVSSVAMMLGRVRDAQGRDDEAEGLLREAVDVIDATHYRSNSWEQYLALAEFLVRRGRDQEAEQALATARERATLLGLESPVLDWIERRAAAARAAAPASS